MSVSLYCRCVCLCCYLDSTCKWYHMVFVFLTFFTQCDSLFKSIHVAANDVISFFLIAE